LVFGWQKKYFLSLALTSFFLSLSDDGDCDDIKKKRKEHEVIIVVVVVMMMVTMVVVVVITLKVKDGGRKTVAAKAYTRE